MGDQARRSVLRLIEQGMCSPSDVERAKDEAKKFLSQDFAMKIRKIEKLLGAAGDSTRIRILLLLSEREMCVCELESALGLTQPTTSHHLGILEQAELVERNKKERWVFYRVRDSPTISLIKDLTRQ